MSPGLCWDPFDFALYFLRFTPAFVVWAIGGWVPALTFPDLGCGLGEAVVTLVALAVGLVLVVVLSCVAVALVAFILVATVAVARSRAGDAPG